MPLTKKERTLLTLSVELGERIGPAAVRGNITSTGVESILDLCLHPIPVNVELDGIEASWLGTIAAQRLLFDDCGFETLQILNARARMILNAGIAMKHVEQLLPTTLYGIDHSITVKHQT